MKFDVSNKVFEDLIIKGGKESSFTLVMLSNMTEPKEIIIMGDLIGKRTQLVNKLEELLKKDNIFLEYRSLEDLYVHCKPSACNRLYDSYGEIKFISINRDILYKILKSNDHRLVSIVSVDEAPFIIYIIFEEVLHEYFFTLKVLDNLQETSRLFNSIIREHVDEDSIQQDRETVGDGYTKYLMFDNGDIIRFVINEVTADENPIFKNCDFSFTNGKIGVAKHYDETDYFLGYDALENEVEKLWKEFEELKDEEFKNK